MAVDEILNAKNQKNRLREQWIGVFIAILAVLLAIGTMGGNNAAKDAVKANLDATNLWAFFQAKNLRRTHYMMWRDDLERQLAAKADMAPELRAKIDVQITDYKERIALLTSDKERMEGLDELFVRAKEQERLRDIALNRDPFFDYSVAFLQIAIVMASVAIVTGGSLALVLLSFFLGVAGTIFMLNGFFLLPGLTPALEAIMGLAGS